MINNLRWAIIVFAIVVAWSVNKARAIDSTDPFAGLALPCPEDKQTLSGKVRPSESSDQVQTDYIRSIFRVEVGDQTQFQGNAALVSSNGFFLTAAHVAAIAGSGKIWLSRPKGDGTNAIERFSANIVYAGKPGSTPANVGNDLALLSVANWTDTTTKPVPLRYTGEHFDSGIFIAFPDATRYATKYDAERVTTDNSDPDGPFKGQAFYGRSGALVIDKYGLGEGIVGAFNNYAEDEIDEVGGDEQFAEYLDMRDRFGAAVITPGAPWLTKIPMDPGLVAVMKNCTNGTASRNDLALVHSYDDLPLNAIDQMFLSCTNLKVSDQTIHEIYTMYIATALTARCAPMATIVSVYSSPSLATNETSEIGRAMLSTYLKGTTGTDHVQLGTSGQQAGNLLIRLAGLIDELPVQSILAQSYAALNAAAQQNVKQDPWLELDLAKSKYELALSQGLIKNDKSPAVASIFFDLNKAQAAGAGYDQVRGLATLVAVKENDWDSAAALANNQIKIMKSNGTLTDAAAISIGKDIDYFAALKSAQNEDDTWATRWKFGGQPHEPLDKKLDGFASYSPKATGAFTSLVLQ
jgi:hypothetical protein